MKKFIILLLICLSSLSFAEWITVQGTDEFGDFTGRTCVASLSKDENATLGFGYHENLGYYGLISCRDYIGGMSERSVVKFKVDKLEPIKANGVILSGNSSIAIILNDEILLGLFEQMKKGTLLRISVEKYDQTKLLYKFDLKDFTKVFNENIK